MFKYVQYDKAQGQYTEYEFLPSTEDVKVNYFTADDIKVVSLEGEEEVINALIAEQPEVINCRELTLDEFLVKVEFSDQIKAIRRQVSNKIAARYSFADELAMRKRAEDDQKRVEYEAYVADCISMGKQLKEAVGYIK